MNVDIAKLKALAEAAKNDCGDYVALNDYGMAVPPAVALELIDDLLCPSCKGSGEGWVLSDSGPDAHHIQVDCPECFGPGTMLGAYQAMKIQRDSHVERTTQVGGELFFMRIERDQLKAENEALRKDLESHKRMLLNAAISMGAIGEALGAEMDDDASELEGLATELRRDAGRYRWLRDGAGYCDTRDIPGMAPARMDAFIDGEISNQKTGDQEGTISHA